MQTDPVADFIVRLKNASAVGKATTVVPFSQLKMSIADVLKKEGFIADVEKKGKKVRKVIEVTLKYDAGEARIRGAKRVSKPSRRVYRSAKEIKSVKNGFGIGVYSTPAGVMTGSEARKQNVGGEIMFEIW